MHASAEGALLLQNILLTKNFESAKVSDVGLAR